MLRGALSSLWGFLPSQWYIMLYVQCLGSSVHHPRSRRCGEVPQGMSNHHMAQRSASNVQRPLYSAQRPGYHHKNVLQRTMSRCIMIKQSPQNQVRTNNYKIQEPLESYKVSHHLIQKPRKQFTLGIFFKLHTSSRLYAIGQV
jgi:hypothetical protein